MVRVGLRQRGARMSSHTIAVQRRSGSTFTPIPNGGQVFPNEAIRYYATGIYKISNSDVHFVVTGPQGIVVDENVSLGLFSDEAYLDTVAPAQEGNYTFAVAARTFPVLPTHDAILMFTVTKAAPPPPTPPPGGGSFFDSLQKLLIPATILVGLVVIGPTIASWGKHR